MGLRSRGLQEVQVQVVAGGAGASAASSPPDSPHPYALDGLSKDSALKATKKRRTPRAEDAPSLPPPKLAMAANGLGPSAAQGLLDKGGAPSSRRLSRRAGSPAVSTRKGKGIPSPRQQRQRQQQQQQQQRGVSALAMPSTKAPSLSVAPSDRVQTSELAALFWGGIASTLQPAAADEQWNAVRRLISASC